MPQPNGLNPVGLSAPNVLSWAGLTHQSGSTDASRCVWAVWKKRILRLLREFCQIERHHRAHQKAGTDHKAQPDRSKHPASKPSLQHANTLPSLSCGVSMAVEQSYA